MFKNGCNRHCKERNLLFDVDIGCTNVYALSTLLKPKEEIIFDRFDMIDNVVVMGQLYEGKIFGDVVLSLVL